MTETNLPLEELKKYGLIDKENQFTSKLSATDIADFKNGSTLQVEDEKQRLSFNLKDDNTKLEVNVYFKDVINHKELSSAELLQLSIDKTNQYKVMADYGTITKMGKDHFRGNEENENSTFVEIENEKGKSRFYGNDLTEKLKDFSVGDKIQIENTGINKSTITVETETGAKDFVKFDNVFKVDDFEESKKKFQSKLFEYDPVSKNVTSIDTTKLDIQEINGIKLTNKQREDLKKGKEIKLDEELNVQYSPNSGNPANLKSTAKMLMVASLAIDGGLSIIVVKGAMKLARMIVEQQKQVEHSKFKAELQKFELLNQAKNLEVNSVQKSTTGKDLVSKSSPETLDKTAVENTPVEKIKVEKKLTENEEVSGFLLEKGEAHYLNEKENGKSYFATILDKNNEEKTIWAVDLKEKLKDTAIFQNVDIKFLGKTEVKIEVPIKDEKGAVLKNEEKTVNRNTYDVKENDNRIITHKDAMEMKSNSEKMNQMKGFLQSKSTLYPENKSIISSINIIDKFVEAKPITPKESTKNIQVVDYDTFEDANKKKEVEKSINVDEEQTKSKSRGR